jgi:hypothetical protein
MVTVTLRVQQPPATILAAFRKNASEWRESRIPTELRGNGIFGVTGAVKHNRCVLKYDRRRQGSLVPLQGRAVVNPDAENGSIVQLAVAPGLSLPPMLLLAIVFAVLVIKILGMPAVPVTVITAAWFGFIVFSVRDAERGIDRTENPEVEYLMRRMEEVVAHAAGVASSRPAADS